MYFTFTLKNKLRALTVAYILVNLKSKSGATSLPHFRAHVPQVPFQLQARFSTFRLIFPLPLGCFFSLGGFFC